MSYKSHNKNRNDSVWLIYDGKCPICVNTAKYYKMKTAVGDLQTLDARQEKNHPIMKKINALRLDIDKGMVLKFRNTHYHGANALQVMALLGSDSDLFNKINSFIFRSKFLSNLFYPVFRTVRNFILFCKGVKKIRNLS